MPRRVRRAGRRWLRPAVAAGFLLAIWPAIPAAATGSPGPSARTAGQATTTGPASPTTGPASPTTGPAGKIWSVQLAWDSGGQAWSTATFAGLRAKGMDHAEINLNWSQIEPAPGHFDFTKLDADIANAAAAGIKLIPIFWQSVWGGNPAGWIQDYDVTSTGARSQLPAWWDMPEQQAYFGYVTQTVAHLDGRAGFGGAFLDYGWLDAMWGPPPPGGSGISGYAAADVTRFRQWLPTRYGTIQHFNAEYGTSYGSWDQVPAATPGQPLFAVYQTFRQWSVADTYSRLTAAVRAESSAPLFYYWGGDFANALSFGNIPDTFFRLARQYGVTVVLDDADQTGLAVAFGSMARLYHVPLLQEWTPRPSGLQAETAQWLGHYGLGEPMSGGLDFFIYQGGPEYSTGFPEYDSWIPFLRSLRGSYPAQPVALYLSFAPGYGAAGDAAGLANANPAITSIWRKDPVGFAVVTDQEVRDHLVNLRSFRAVLPLNGTDQFVQAYASEGGHVLSDPGQLADYATPYLSLVPNGGVVEADPTVSAARNRAWISLAGVNPNWAYNGSAIVTFAGLGLRSGTYHLADARTGAAVPARPVAGGLCAPLHLASGDLAMWDVLPGPAPPGSPVPATCPQPVPGSTTVTATAGLPPDGLAFLNVGTTQPGSDGNLRLVMQDGQQAVATWTAQQSGVSGAYAYLQIDPSSPVDSAATVQLSVTYWAAPGQGFQVQYNGTGGSYQAGPAVSSPGTGQWV
ncbi:MAG TPA: beta-galactosidase, partial [Streptosporangiaceae bacterium]